MKTSSNLVLLLTAFIALAGHAPSSPAVIGGDAWFAMADANYTRTDATHFVVDGDFTAALTDAELAVDADGDPDGDQQYLVIELPAVDDDTLLMVCSDHGFAPFGRQFHLNTWLRDNGWLALKPGAERKPETSVFDIDWSRTAAYGMGFNGLYLNLKNREAKGIVDPEKAPTLLAKLQRELEAVTDPETCRISASTIPTKKLPSICHGVRWVSAKSPLVSNTAPPVRSGVAAMASRRRSR